MKTLIDLLKHCVKTQLPEKRHTVGSFRSQPRGNVKKIGLETCTPVSVSSPPPELLERIQLRTEVASPGSVAFCLSPVTVEDRTDGVVCWRLTFRHFPRDVLFDGTSFVVFNPFIVVIRDGVNTMGELEFFLAPHYSGLNETLRRVSKKALKELIAKRVNDGLVDI